MLDPQARALLARMAAGSPPPADLAGLRQWYRRTRLSAAGEAPRTRVANHWIDGPGGPLALRQYRAEEREATSPGPLPALLWLHGGGWMLGDLDTHDALCRRLSRQAGCAVFALDYRLAPEHPFPAAFEDVLAAYAWIAEEAGALAVDARRLCLGGDNAGANLAAAAALALRAAPGLPAPRFQALLYPALDLRSASIEASASYREFADGPMLTRADMEGHILAYLGGTALAEDWRASPLAAETLAGAAPAYVLTAGFDPLREEGAAYAARLAAEGVQVTHECFEGQVHGFALLAGELAAAHHALYRVAQYLRLALRGV